MNETNTMADREKLLAAIRMWLQSQKQRQEQQKTNVESDRA